MTKHFAQQTIILVINSYTPKILNIIDHEFYI